MLKAIASYVFLMSLLPNAYAHPYGPGWTVSEQWAWDQIRTGNAADFQQHCGELDPGSQKDARWHDSCRAIRSAFLEQLLTDPAWSKALRRQGVHLVGAYLPDGLDLSGATISAAVWIDKSVIAGDTNLRAAEFDGPLILNGSTFEHGIDALALSGRFLLITNGTRVKGNLTLARADIKGDVVIIEARIDGNVSADELNVGRTFHCMKANIEGDLTLRGAKIGVGLDCGGAELGGSFFADGLQVGSTVALNQDMTVGGDVVMTGATVGSSVEMNHAFIIGDVSISSAKISGSLFLNDSEILGDTLFTGSRVGLTLEMTESTFDGEVSTEDLHVGATAILRQAVFKRVPKFYFSDIGTHFDLSGATLPGLDLSESYIHGELRLATKRYPRPYWAKDALLNLHGTRVGAIQDWYVAGEPDAWPSNLDLQMFVYDRLGGSVSAGRELLVRDDNWYSQWLNRDKVFTYQPYRQLATNLRAAGEPIRADGVVYAARERERESAWRECRESGKDCRTAAGLWLLSAMIGYGLGDRYFRALYWVAGISLLGVAILWCSADARRKGVAWCFGASMNRLLPLVELNREFVDFFDDPDRERVNGWQVAYFSLHAIAGYVLGSFVVAGLAGLTQSP